MVLQSLYRNPLVYTDEGLEGARRGLERLNTAMRGYTVSPVTPSAEMERALADARARFRTAMDDDFNTPVAVSVLFEIARAANRADGADRLAAQAQLAELASVLGLELGDSGTGSGANADPFIDLLVAVRDDLRGQKLWAMADNLRDRLAELGVTIEDTASGTTWRRQG
jgi:cysteinyl-tRNA synthetase